MSPKEDRTHDAVDSEPKHYQLSYSGPPTILIILSSPLTFIPKIINVQREKEESRETPTGRQAGIDFVLIGTEKEGEREKRESLLEREGGGGTKRKRS